MTCVNCGQPIPTPTPDPFRCPKCRGAKSLSGKVIAQNGRYFEIECQNAPAHLQTMNLVKWQMRGAQVGDAVRLAYEVDHRSGLWNVAEIL